MTDAGSILRSRLKQSFDLNLFTQTLKTYGYIQQEAIEHTEALIKLGVDDWRLHKLPDRYNDFIQSKKLLVDEALNLEEIEQLTKLKSNFNVLCSALSEFNIPLTKAISKLY